VNNRVEYIIDWLFDYLCENKLFWSIKNRTNLCTNPIVGHCVNSSTRHKESAH
jgi:hypothetical protein